MPRDSEFLNSPCAYCGTVTGNNEREDVVPLCTIPLEVRSSAKLIKVPSCARCNDEFANDEAHFKSIIAVAGLDPCDGRQELYESSMRGFRRSKPDFIAFLKEMVETPGAPRELRVYPGRDPRVLNVVRKIVRGLCHRHDRAEVVAAERVYADIMRFPIPPFFDAELETVYEVPRTVRCRAMMFGDFDAGFGFHSAWLIRFFDKLEFIAVVSVNGMTPVFCRDDAAGLD